SLAAFGHARGEVKVTFGPPHLRHYAESAVVVAALDDSYEVADASTSSGRQRLALRVVVTRVQICDEGVVLADGHDHRVKRREAPPELGRLYGYYASGQRLISIRG